MKRRHARAGRWLWIVVMLVAIAGIAVASAARESPPRVAKPTLDSPRGDRCVMDSAFMRRNHMKLLLHERERTVHEGVRAAETSLRKCIGCHANGTTGSVIGDDHAFCQGCHSYAAVRLDCFECHSSRSGAVDGAKPRDSARAAP